MTRAEWLKLAVELQARWPNRELTDESLAIWFEDLSHLPAEQVRTGILALYRDGREWCPNGAQILAKVSELGRDDPDHGEAWRMVNEALWKHAPYNWTAFYAYLAERSPAVAEAARRYGFETQNGYLKSEEGTVRAQFREIFKAVCRERQHDSAYVGLPNAGLRGLEREPRKLGEALQRALPPGTDRRVG